MQIFEVKNILGFLFFFLFFYCIGTTTTLYNFDRENLLINNYTMMLSLFVIVMLIVAINVFVLSQSEKILLYSFFLGIVIGVNSEFDYICGKNSSKTLANSLGQILTLTIGLTLTSFFMYYLQQND